MYIYIYKHIYINIYIYIQCIYGDFLKWGYSKSSILLAFSIINHPAIGIPLF